MQFFDPLSSLNSAAPSDRFRRRCAFWHLTEIARAKKAKIDGDDRDAPVERKKRSAHQYNFEQDFKKQGKQTKKAFLDGIGFACVFGDVFALRRVFVCYIAACKDAFENTRFELFGAAGYESGAEAVVEEIASNLAQDKADEQQRGRKGFKDVAGDGVIEYIAFEKLKDNSENRACKHSNKRPNKVAAIIFDDAIHRYLLLLGKR